MSIWIVVLLGPLVAIMAGYGLVKGASLLSSLPNDTFARLIRASEGFTLLLVGALVVGLVVGFVLLWQLSPWLALFVLAVLAINGSGAWSYWWRHRPPQD